MGFEGDWADHDGGDAAHEEEAAAGLQVLAGLLGDKELAFDVDGEDFVNFGACDFVEVAEMLNAGVTLALSGQSAETREKVVVIRG